MSQYGSKTNSSYNDSYNLLTETLKQIKELQEKIQHRLSNEHVLFKGHSEEHFFSYDEGRLSAKVRDEEILRICRSIDESDILEELNEWKLFMETVDMYEPMQENEHICNMSCRNSKNCLDLISSIDNQQRCTTTTTEYRFQKPIRGSLSNSFPSTTLSRNIYDDSTSINTTTTTRNTLSQSMQEVPKLSYDSQKRKKRPCNQHFGRDTTLKSLGQILSLWDKTFIPVIQKLILLKYVDQLKEEHACLFSLSKKHYLYGCFYSGRIHLCHPILELRHLTCDSTCCLDPFTGEAKCAFSGLVIKSEALSDIYRADRNLSAIDMPLFKRFSTYGIQKVAGYQYSSWRKDVPAIGDNKFELSNNKNVKKVYDHKLASFSDSIHPIKRKLDFSGTERSDSGFSGVIESSSSSSEDKGIYINNLGSHIKFQYIGTYCNEKVIHEAEKYFLCLKNSCLALYWYKTCILKNSYKEFSLKKFDHIYGKYWAVVWSILPKIYNMHQSYIHTKSSNTKHSITKKCSLVSLILGISGLVNAGMTMFEIPVILAIDTSPVGMPHENIEHLSWDLIKFNGFYDEKLQHLINEDIFHNNSSNVIKESKSWESNLSHSSDSHSIDSSSSSSSSSSEMMMESDNSFIEMNRKKSRYSDKNSALYVSQFKDTFVTLNSGLKRVQKSMKGESVIYFCDVVKNKSGSFGYTSHFNNGVKTIIDVCHACDMDPRTMSQLFYY